MHFFCECRQFTELRKEIYNGEILIPNEDIKHSLGWIYNFVLGSGWFPEMECYQIQTQIHTKQDSRLSAGISNISMSTQQTSD